MLTYFPFQGTKLCFLGTIHWFASIPLEAYTYLSSLRVQFWEPVRYTCPVLYQKGSKDKGLNPSIWNKFNYSKINGDSNIPIIAKKNTKTVFGHLWDFKRKEKVYSLLQDHMWLDMYAKNSVLKYNYGTYNVSVIAKKSLSYL